MSEIAILAWLSGLSPWIPLVLALLGILVIAGQAVVVITPSQADDAAVSKLLSVPILGGVLKALAEMAPIKKK